MTGSCIYLLSSMKESMCRGSFGSIQASQSVVSLASDVSTAAAAAAADAEGVWGWALGVGVANTAGGAGGVCEGF